MLAQLCSHPRPCTKTNSRRNPPEQAERSPFKAFQGSASSFSSSSAGRALLPPGAGSWGARKEKKNTTEHSTAGYGALGGWGEERRPRSPRLQRAASGGRRPGRLSAPAAPPPAPRRPRCGCGGAAAGPPAGSAAPAAAPPAGGGEQRVTAGRGRASRAGPGASRSVPLRPSLRPAAPTRRGSGSLPPAASIAEPPAGLTAACVAMATAAGNTPRLLPGGSGRGCSDAEGAGWGGKGRGGGTGTGTGTGTWTWTGAGPRLQQPPGAPRCRRRRPDEPPRCVGGSRGEAEAAAGPGLRGGGRLRGP